MAVVSWYFSSSMPGDGVAYTAPSVAGNGNAAVGSKNSQTTSFSTDDLEIRINTGGNEATMTKERVEKFLEDVRLWLYDTNEGLDALLLANSATVGIP